MIQDKRAWEEFEAEWQRNQKSSLEANLRVLETLLEHARPGRLASPRPAGRD